MMCSAARRRRDRARRAPTSMLTHWKRLLSSRYPSALTAYHAFRRARQLQEVRYGPTALGFRFGGHTQMQAGEFEPDETAFLRGALGDADVFIDIGANVGFFSCLARSLGTTVVAVEPLPHNLELLYANLIANDWTDVEVFPVGLGERPALVPLYGGGTGASVVTSWSTNNDALRRTIPLSTLDTLVASRFPGQRLVLKIDVEGAELDVLRGGLETLRRTPPPVWLVEVCLTENFPGGINPRFADVFDLFRNHGYRARTVGPHSRTVTQIEVERWVTNRHREFGHVNYAFEAETNAGPA
jgi:FkbM family methyltransferase